VNIGDLLIQQQNSFFVGREEEMAALAQCMTAPDWRLIHIHGTGGIGKTSLFRLFAQSVGSTRCLYLDGHGEFQHPDDFLKKLRQSLPVAEDDEETTSVLNAYAVRHQGVILLLDTFEKWGAMEDWLRREWFPRLSPHVKIGTAGRYPLEDQWLRDGWHSFVRNIELQPLSYDEVRTYAHNRGIEQADIVASLQRFSNGLPLAMSMACEIILRKGSAGFLDKQQQDHIVAYLVEELTRDVGEGCLKRCMEAASMVWYFDQELLEALLQEKIPSDLYREFCRLPFVIRQAERWLLHDSVRHWVFTDLRSRMPRTFQLYRKHAWEALLEREALFPHRRTELTFERLYLHELDFVRDLRFQWDDRLRFRACRAPELPLVERLYREYLQHQSNYVPGEAHLASLIRPLWQLDPSSFYGLWKEEELVAFCSCIQLTEQTVRIFRSNPITAPIASRFHPDRRQYLLCLTGVSTQLEYSMTGSVARALVQIIERNRDADFLNLISIPYWLRYLPLLGFRRAAWADSTTPLGVRYLGHELDLRHEDFSTRLNRMYETIESTISIGQEPATVSASAAELPLEEAVKLVQRALRHYSRLPLSPEIVQSLHPLLTELPSGSRPEKIAEAVQSAIQDTLRTFQDGSEEEQRFYRILHHAYIRKIGTHEVVSEYLNIPVKSYYRYLQAAVRMLAYGMMKDRS